ncbi:MAG TPA: hypothetical protein VFT40_12050, partial [Sphingomicrobium sp.]|nr:hypothetical protein [Sphingomicrobium sp.]
VITGGYLRVTTTGLIQIDTNGGGDNWTLVGNVNTGAGPYAIQYLSGGVAVTVNVTAVAPPIALDLDGDGQVSFLATDTGAAFDYGGGTVATAWVAANDGILVRDGNHDGQISADEIVFATSGSDLEGLARYDSNGDGQLSSADEGFGDFGVWQDADSDGQVDDGELQSLTAHSIASISLSSDGQSYTAAGGDVTVVGTGSFTRTDGSTGVLADAVFATANRVDDTTKALVTSGSNAVLLAAVAAAGLAASAPASQSDGGEDDGGQSVGSLVPATAAATFSVPGESAGVQSFTDADLSISLPTVVQSSLVHGSAPQPELSLIQEQSFAPAELSELSQGTVANHAGDLPAPAMVALPSAEMIQAAFAGEAGTEGEANAALAIVAQALADGGQNEAVDAILDAGMPAQASGGNVAAALIPAVFGMAEMSLPMDHGFAMQHMMAHPDAVQQA